MSFESEIATLLDVIPKHRAHAQHWRRKAKEFPAKAETYLRAAHDNYSHAMTYLDWVRQRRQWLAERERLEAMEIAA